MPSTHLSLRYHVIFSTKGRLPMITSDLINDLHAYLGGIVKDSRGVPLAIGGVEDHVHLLLGLRATHRLDYIVRDIKSGSSSWVHEEWGRKKFGWQEGYFATTVSKSQIVKVRKYVLSQREHHRRQTFQHEYIELLKLNNIDYDPRYLWVTSSRRRRATKVAGCKRPQAAPRLDHASSIGDAR